MSERTDIELIELAIEDAKIEVASEQLGGNIAKENFARGKLDGLRIAMAIVEDE